MSGIRSTWQSTTVNAPCLSEECAGSLEPQKVTVHSENTAPGEPWSHQWVSQQCLTCDDVRIYNPFVVNGEVVGAGQVA